VTVLRLTNTYGPRMRVKDARQTFLGYWFRLAVDGEEIQIWGDGMQKRDFNYVDDAVRAFLLAASRDEAVGKIYNLGDDEIVSLKDLAEIVIAANGNGSYQIIPFPPERKAIDIGDYYGNHGRIRAELGWAPKVRLAEGIERSLAFYKENGNAYWERTAA
jgi:UDP-glucose 4-epimerase